MKQIIIIPAYLNMSPGKVASQVGHIVEMQMRFNDSVFSYHPRTEARVILKVNTAEELLAIVGNALMMGLKPMVFVDSAPTTEGTDGKVTAVGITEKDEVLKHITGHLELY